MNELLQIRQEIPEGYVLSFDNPYASAFASDLTPTTKYMAVTYYFRSNKGTLLDDALIGKLDFDCTPAIPLVAAPLVAAISGLFFALHFVQDISARRKLATLADRIKTTRAKLTSEASYVIQAMSSTLFPEGKTLVTKMPPKYNGDIHGILGVRTWRLISDSKGKVLLLSLFRDSPWDSPVFIADKKPEAKNASGVYSNVLRGKQVDNTCFAAIDVKKDLAVGLIENRGKVVEHADGTLRGQYGRIVFLAIHESHKDIAVTLSLQYRVPVVISSGLLILEDYPIGRKEITI